jgi:hypothetical protein
MAISPTPMGPSPPTAAPTSTPTDPTAEEISEGTNIWDRQYVYVTARDRSGMGALNSFGRDPTTGVLSFLNAVVEGDIQDAHDGGTVTVSNLTSPGSLAVSPNGKNVYVLDTFAAAPAVTSFYRTGDGMHLPPPQPLF